MKTLFNLAMAFVVAMILASSCNNEPMKEPVQDDTVNFTATMFSGYHMALGKSGMYMIFLSDDNEIHTYMFTLNNQLGEVDDNDYVTIPSGTYTQSENSGDYTIATYAIYVDQSESVENPKTAELTESTVVVSENKIVLTAVIEGVTHIVTYNGSLSMPADLPASDVDFEANYAYAYYTESTEEENSAKFKLFLSDLGYDENDNVLPNATYYRLTLCVDKLDSNAEIRIPAGRYEIDNTTSPTGYISDAMYYKFGENILEDTTQDMIMSGYLTINEDGSIEASFDLYFSGATHNVSFSGDIAVLDNTIPSKAPYSTLTLDKVCDLSNHSLSIWNRGDIYGVGCNVLALSITPDNSVGDNLVFELLCGTDKDDNISGVYTISNSMKEFTAIRGYVDGFTLMSSWYYYQSNALDISEFAPIVDGWIDVQVTDSETCTVTFNVYDDLNNNITGTYTYVASANVSGVSHPAINL